MGEAGTGERPQVVGTVGVEGEGAEGAAQCLGHALVIGAEVAHMQLVECDVLRRGQRRLDQAVPARGLELRGREVHDLAPPAVAGEADRVGVGHEVVLHAHGRARPDLDLVEVELPGPPGLARRAPDAGGGIDVHRDHRVRRRRARGAEQVQLDRPRSGRPQPQGGDAGRQRHAQPAVVGEELVQDAWDLHAGGVHRRASGIERGDGELALEGGGHLRQPAGGHVEGGVGRQVREGGLLVGGEAGRIVDEGDGHAARHAIRAQGERARGRVVEADVPVRPESGGVPGHGVGRDPMGAGAGQVAAGSGVRADGERVGAGIVGEHDLRAGRRHRKGDVGPVADAARAVVLVPALADRYLGFVVAGGQRARAEAVEAVAVRVLEPGPQASWIPVPRASELALEAARGDCDHLRVVVGHPMRLVRVVELDRGGGGEAQADVGAVP